MKLLYYLFCSCWIIFSNVNAFLQIPAALKIGTAIVPSVVKIGSMIGSAATLWYYKDDLRSMIPENCYTSVQTPDYSKIHNEIFGQQLALSIVPDMFKAHIKNPNPKRPLMFYFHGWSGTGKNHLAHLLLQKIYPNFEKNSKSRFVHTFTGTHYDADQKPSGFQAQTMEIIREKLKTCPTSVFIFDEVDFYPPKFLDFLTGCMSSTGSDDVQYNKAIFLLLGNSHGNMINTLYHRKTEEEGLKREDLSFEDFEEDVLNVIKHEGPFVGSTLLRNGHIQLIVPFLPLTREHLHQCIVSEFQKAGFPNPNIYPGPTIIEKIMKKQTFSTNGLYATQGCRNIDSTVQKEILLLRNVKREL